MNNNNNIIIKKENDPIIEDSKWYTWAYALEWSYLKNLEFSVLREFVEGVEMLFVM